MTAPTLLRELQWRGAVITMEGATLWVEPREVLTDELRASIRAHKSEILALLSSFSAAPDSVTPWSRRDPVKVPPSPQRDDEGIDGVLLARALQRVQCGPLRRSSECHVIALELVRLCLVGADEPGGEDERTAHERGKTQNGHPLVFDAGAALRTDEKFVGRSSTERLTTQALITQEAA